MQAALLEFAGAYTLCTPLAVVAAPGCDLWNGATRRERRDGWSADQIAQVRDLAAAGLTASKIGERFSKTRNAVLGLAHREGIAFPAKVRVRAGRRAGGTRTVYKVRPIPVERPADPRTVSAMRVIGKRDAIWRCDRDGKQNPEGHLFWLRGRVRTEAEIIAEADREIAQIGSRV